MAFQVIDADGHVLDNRELVFKYLPEPFKRREWWWTPRNTWDTTLGGKSGQPDVDSQEWLRAMERGGLEQAVLFPTRLLNIGFVQEREMAAALCQAYNSYLYDEYLKVSGRFRGIALLPLQDVSEAVRELRRAVTELGMVGGMLPTHGPPSRPLLGNAVYFPLYEEAQRLGCVLCLHATVTNPSGPEIDPYERMIESHTLVHPFGQMRQLTSLVFQGVFERFPDLTFVSLEARASWVPFFMERLDEEYHWRGAEEAPGVSVPPSHYFRSGRIYVSCEPDEALLPQVLEFVGEDYFVYASDYPHPDSDFPGSITALAERGDLSEATKAKLLGENARRLYRLDGG